MALCKGVELGILTEVHNEQTVIPDVSNNVLWMPWSLQTHTNPKVKELIDNYQSKLNDTTESQTQTMNLFFHTKLFHTKMSSYHKYSLVFEKNKGECDLKLYSNRLSIQQILNCDPLKDRTAQSTGKILFNYSLTFRIPVKLYSDRDPVLMKQNYFNY